MKRFKRILVLLTVVLFPSPKATNVVYCLSTVEAATVMIQGATFSTDIGRGPSLPAEQEVRTPLLIAWNDPIAIGSEKKSREGPPIDTDMKFTPSAMASSKPASMSMSLHPMLQHTLYIAMRADGTPPRAVPLPMPYKLASFTATPAAVDAVCVPWP